MDRHRCSSLARISRWCGQPVHRHDSMPIWGESYLLTILQYKKVKNVKCVNVHCCLLCSPSSVICVFGEFFQWLQKIFHKEKNSYSSIGVLFFVFRSYYIFQYFRVSFWEVSSSIFIDLILFLFNFLVPEKYVCFLFKLLFDFHFSRQ